MKRKPQFKRTRTASFHVLISLAFLFHFDLSECSAQPTGQKNAGALNWQIENIRDGVNWWSYHGDDLFDARLSINMIEVIPGDHGIGFEIVFVQDELLKTSVLAFEKDAFAAVNGSFFNLDAGGSVVFMKVKGDVISDGAVRGNPYTENGGIGWNNNDMPSIFEKPENGWHSMKIENLLSSGPLLVDQGEKKEFNNDPFHQNRHPRTAVAATEDGRLLLVTVDGRSFQSYGMTIPELARFFIDLGANQALNLDGGGSTSMYIKGKNLDGIVNYPSDNLEFDHEGERGVSNAIILVNN